MAQAWPTGKEYSDAVQNPHICFQVQALQSGIVKLNRMGLPMGTDGNFAIVFRLQCGANAFAIKCFKEPGIGREQHYQALGDYLSGLNLPCLTQFTYLPDAIRVNKQLFPIVRMEWAEARQLDQYVESRLANHQDFTALADQLRQVMQELRDHHIAHGDLQHGNVLVDGQDRIRLVDYDGMYVPPLQGIAPTESGHHNYQHPLRHQHGSFDEYSDTFAAVVIELSLRALGADPSLWKDFYNGDNLIFSAPDFRSPGSTPLWQRLKGIQDAHVHQLTDCLERLCHKSLPDIESIEEIYDQIALGTQSVAAGQGWVGNPNGTASGGNVVGSGNQQPVPPIAANTNIYATQPLTPPNPPPPMSSTPSVPLPLETWPEDNSGQTLRIAMIIVLICITVIVATLLSFFSPVVKRFTGDYSPPATTTVPIAP